MTKGGPANPSLLLLTGLPEVINLGKEIPMIVASPQGIYTWTGSHVALDAYVEFLKTNFRIDPSRIFLTGLSDGGIGDFEYANFYPSKIKAMAPTSTWPTADIHNFLNIPVWAFMGDIDSKGSLITWISQLKAIGGNATYTEYPGAHTKAVWNTVYNGSRGDDIYSWLLNSGEIILS